MGSIAYKNKVAIVYILGFFIDMVNTFITTIAFPAMSIELHASTAQLAWVITAYALGLTLVIPVSSWFSDKYGTKTLFITSLFIFTISSFFCGFSTSIFELICFRFLQGLGGGLLIPVGQTMLFREFPVSEKARISALVMIPGVIAPALSPSIGGLIVEYFTWNYVFYVNIPFGIILILMSFFWLREKKQKAQYKIDVFGLVIISVALFILLMATYYLSNPETILLGCIALVITVLIFLLYIAYHKQKNFPILDLNLLKNKNYAGSIFVYLIISISFSGVNILIIYLFQNVLGLSAAKTGTLTIPMGLGMMTGLKLSGSLYNKIGPKPLVLFGCISATLMIILFCFIDNASQYYVALPILFIYGCANPTAANSLLATAYVEINEKMLSKASAMWNLNRQIGMSLGVAIFSAILSEMLINANLTLNKIKMNDPYAIHVFHTCFIIAATINFASIFGIRKINNSKILSMLHASKKNKNVIAEH